MLVAVERMDTHNDTSYDTPLGKLTKINGT